MKKTTQLKAMLFSTFLLLGSIGLFAQQYHVKTNIQKWKAASSSGAYVNDGNYTDGDKGEKTGIVITPSYLVRPGAKIKNEDGSEFSKGYIQLKNKDKAATIKFLPYTGVKSFKINIIAGKNQKISLYNGEEKLTVFDKIGKTGVSKTFSIPTGREEETFNFILKDQTGPVSICDIEIEKSGSETKVATPVIAPSEGAVINNSTVEISCATEGAKIYYTIDGKGDPTESDLEYTAPIKLEFNKQYITIKAKAFKAGFFPSDVAEATLEKQMSPPGTVKTIAELRGSEVVRYYYLEGSAIVSFHSKAQKVLYIEDATGAILIKYEKELMEDYETGTEITYLYGKLTNNDGMLELIAEGVESSDKPGARTPTEIELEDLTTDDQAKLVKVKNIKLLKEDGEVFAQGKNIKIEGSDVELRPQYSDLDYLKKPVPEKAQTIVAVVLVHDGIIQLVPRSFEEMTATGLPRILATSKLYSTEGKIHFEAKTGEIVEIYNALGQLIYKTTAHSGLNTIDAPQGIIILKIGNATEKVIVK